MELNFDRLEEKIFSNLLEASDSIPTNLYVGPVDQLVKHSEEHLLYQKSQMSRLVTAMYIGLRLESCDVDLSIFDMRYISTIAHFGDVVKLGKAFTAWPLAAKQSTQEVPEQVPNWNYEYFFGPAFRSFVRGRVISPSSKRNQERSLVLAQLILRLKRSSLDVTNDFVYKALRDHGVEISKEDPTDQDPETNEKILCVKKHIQKIVNDVFPDRVVLSQYAPTSGACMTETGFGTRKQGGAFTANIKKREVDGLPKSVCTPVVSSTHLFKMYHVCDQVFEVRVPIIDMQDLYPTIDEVLDEGFNTLGQTCTKVLANESVRCQAVPIIEPFKVRVITKGESHKYYLGLQLQRAMTKYMKRYCSFPALSKRIEAEDVLCKEPTWYISGDYKGATDTLSRELSKFTLDTLFMQKCILSPMGELLNGTFQNICVDTLVNHVINYTHEHPNGETETWQVEQRRGQLMGSFLSFPVLNIVNLAVNRAFCEYYNLKYSRLLVNGDDVLLTLNKSENQSVEPLALDRMWTQFVKDTAGFTKSVGKNYISDEFCTINSQLFSARSGKEVPCVKTEVLFNNTWGNKKSLGSDLNKIFDGNPMNIGKLVTYFVDSVPGENKILGLSAFLQINKKKLIELDRPWFLPSSFGGLGLPCLKNDDRWETDGKTMAFIMRMMNTGKYHGFWNTGPVSHTTESRSCDLKAAALDMEYLKNLRYRPDWYLVPVDRRFESLVEHDCHYPKLNTAPWMHIQSISDTIPQERNRICHQKETMRIKGLTRRAQSSKLEAFRLDEFSVELVYTK